MIKYWIRIIEKYDDNSLVYKTYNMMYLEVTHGRATIDYNWAAQIKMWLDELGFSDVWNNQKHMVPNFMSIKQRIIDQYKQLWLANITESRKLKWYRLFKENFCLEQEKYLLCINNYKFRNALCKFRVSAHSLEIETGRYNATPLNQRVCKFCSAPQVENEYHFLLVCPVYTNLRRKFLPRFCWSFANVQKFRYLMCTNSERSILNIGKYVFYAFKLRKEMLSNTQ